MPLKIPSAMNSSHRTLWHSICKSSQCTSALHIASAACTEHQQRHSRLNGNRHTFCIFSTISYTVLPSVVYRPPFPTGIVRVISDAYPPRYSQPASMSSTWGRNVPCRRSLNDAEGIAPQHPRPAGLDVVFEEVNVGAEPIGWREVGKILSLHT